MRIILNKFLLLGQLGTHGLVLVALCGGLLAPGVVAAPAATPETLLRQVAGLLDYISTDYAGAVSPEGKILDDGEFREQLSLAEDARKLALAAGLAQDDPIVGGLGVLGTRLVAAPPPAEVLKLCRELRATLVKSQGLVLEPSRAPDRERARALYGAQNCAQCHGETGAADTPLAQTLTPPPANFLDATRVAGVSPARAFHALTFGMPGTAMVAFDALSDADRWSLAFLVLSLRHDSADMERGRAVFERAGRPVSPTFTRLSQLTEQDIEATLAGVSDPGERDAALAWLRHDAPFALESGGKFDLARDLVHDAVEAHGKGDVEEARRLFVSAYLDGIEPHEATLRAKDASLVHEIEERMLKLRERAGAGAPGDEVEQLSSALLSSLDRAEEGGLSPAAAFGGSFLIALREGFEAVLLLGALLGMVRKRGVPEHAKYVHWGWVTALMAGLLTWLLAGHMLGGMQRELAEGIIALVAAAVLLGVTHWTLGQVTARQWMGFLAKRIGTAGGGWAVLALAFIAVYREVFEVVLFYQALLMDAVARRGLVLLGAVAGVAALVAITFVLRTLGQALKPARFMLATGIVLALLSFIFVGEGVHALQEAGVISVTSVTFFTLRVLGIHATLEGLLAQGVLLLFLMASAAWTVHSVRRDALAPV